MFRTVKGYWISSNVFVTNKNERLFVMAYGMERNKYKLPMKCYLLLYKKIVITVFAL